MTQEKTTSLIQWHRLLGQLLEELLTPVGITVFTGFPIMTNPPEADVLLLRREEQADKSAHHLAQCFKQCGTQRLCQMLCQPEKRKAAGVRRLANRAIINLCAQHLLVYAQFVAVLVQAARRRK